MKKTIAITAAVATSIALGGVASPASAAQTVPSVASSEASKPAVQFSDADVLEFVLTGRGPLAEAFPELSAYVPTTSRALTAAEKGEVLAKMLEQDPQLHENVTVPLQSGDPYLTLAAINSLQDTAASVAEANGTIDGAATGYCATVLVTAMAIVVVLGLFLWVPAVAAQSTLTNEEFAAELTNAFAK